MDGPCADWVIDAKEFEQIHTEDDDDTGDSAEHAGTGGANPVARTGDRHQTGEEAVGDGARIPLAGTEVDEEFRRHTGRAGCKGGIGGDATDTAVVHR